MNYEFWIDDIQTFTDLDLPRYQKELLIDFIYIFDEYPQNTLRLCFKANQRLESKYIQDLENEYGNHGYSNLRYPDTRMFLYEIVDTIKDLLVIRMFEDEDDNNDEIKKIFRVFGLVKFVKYKDTKLLIEKVMITLNIMHPHFKHKNNFITLL